MATPVPDTRPSIEHDRTMAAPAVSGIRRKQYEEKQRASLENADPQKKALKEAERYAQQLLMRVVFIENPIQKTLSGVLSKAKELNDPELAQKVETKFQRIFQSFISEVKVARSNAEVILRALKELGEKNGLTRDDVVNLVALVKKSAPALRDSLIKLSPDSHKEAVEHELQRQVKLHEQMQEFMGQNANAPPAAKIKMEAVMSGAQRYIEGLQEILDPDFEDRLRTAVERLLKEDFPRFVAALKSLIGTVSGSEKTGSTALLRKKLRKVAKRIVLLTYLRDKS